MKIEDNFNFKNLFVLDMANNHQGDFNHGLQIIKECSNVVSRLQVRAAIKFQFRDLPTFVHVDQRENSKNKHVPRFLSTRLPWSDYKKLKEAATDQGLITICTPFDEESVKKIVEMSFDVIKVASCSANDWPLLEEIAGAGLPIIASTGGLSLEEIDRLVSFFEHRGCDFALMHCVSIYPTPDHTCNLNNISNLIERYKGTVVGWSTHEPPSDTVQVGLAVALGGQMFERHVGVETNSIKLNGYSSTPTQLEAWMNAYKRAKTILGSRERTESLPEEKNALDGLSRGVFTNKDIKSGEKVLRKDVTFAFPFSEGQLVTKDWNEEIVAKTNIKKGGPIWVDSIEAPSRTPEMVLKKAIHAVKALINKSGIILNSNFTTEYSHHYGVNNFFEVGVVLINVINREYAKKILVQLAGQKHPAHYHKLKEETFIVTWGTLNIFVDGKERVLNPGDILTVYPGVWHSFSTATGCVFEEISTTAFAGDSVYRDADINKLTPGERKTNVDHWGRFQIKEQLINAEEQKKQPDKDGDF